jgi:hypothetical protein
MTTPTRGSALHSYLTFGHLVFKTLGQNFYKSLNIKRIGAKVKKPKNEQKCALFDTPKRVALDFSKAALRLAQNLPGHGLTPTQNGRTQTQN